MMFKVPHEKGYQFQYLKFFCEFVRLSLKTTRTYVRQGKSRACRCYSIEVLERALVYLKNLQKVRERFLFDFDFVGSVV